MLGYAPNRQRQTQPLLQPFCIPKRNRLATLNIDIRAPGHRARGIWWIDDKGQ
jgi:hypothetical protein